RIEPAAVAARQGVAAGRARAGIPAVGAGAGARQAGEGAGLLLLRVVTVRPRDVLASACAALAMLAGLSPAMAAQVVAIALDGKAVLEDGELRVRPGAGPGALAVLRFEGARAEHLGTVALPTGFQGPPNSVAITPDGRYALATASMRI